MSDFAQTGLICTLQRLNETHLAEIEAEMPELAASRPISLILPCHASDLDRPALAHICRELQPAAWLREIVVSINGGGLDLPHRAATAFQSLPQARILWNEGPELSAKHARALGVAPQVVPHGKGLNVWAALGLICSEQRSEVVATIDCDVSSFTRSGLARLCYPLLHPKLDFAFAKMYYSRVTDQLYGRVSRLFLAPLLQAFVRLAGHHPLVDFLLSFRYPLAGECAMRRMLAADLPIEPGWGLEIGMLCELHRQADPRTLCQVDGGAGYDHKHQSVLPALQTMASQIAGTLLRNMAREGVALSAGFLAALREAYQREAMLAVQRSAALAAINRLAFREETEQETVELFREIITWSAESASSLPPCGRQTAARA